MNNPSTSQARSSQTQAFPGARAALVLLIFINLFNYIDRQVLAAVLDPIKASLFQPGSIDASSWLGKFQDWCQGHLGFKPELALLGVLSMAFMVTYMIGAPLFGKLAEKRSRWLLIGVGVTLWSLASGASGLAAGFWALLLTRCFVGIGEAAYGPVAPTLLSDYYPVKVRGQVLSWFYMAIPVGSALGYVIGGAVAHSNIGAVGEQWFGLKAESWRWAFYLLLPPGVLLGVLAFLRRDPPRGQADLAAAAAPAKVTLHDYLILLKTPSYVLCTLGMAAMTFAIGGIGFWMPYYLSHKPGAPKGVEVTFGAITCVAGLIATLLGGMAGDKLRSRFSGSYFLVSAIAMALGFPFVLGVLHAGFPAVWALIFVTCFCLFFNTGPTNTILANVTHPALRAAGFALNIFVIHALGDVISPVIIGILGDQRGMNFAFRLVAVMFLVASALWLAGIKFLKRDTEMAPVRFGRQQPPSPSPGGSKAG